MMADSWLPASDVDFCHTCGTIDGVDSNDALIAWPPESGIRPGDIVILEYDTRSGVQRAYLKAERFSRSIILRTRCGIPDFIVHDCGREASNGLIVTRIIGVLRGSYLCF